MEEEEEEDTEFIEPLARSYTDLRATNNDEIDRTWGLDKYSKSICKKGISIIYNNIIVDDVEYKGTQGLWELIVEKRPKYLTKEDYDNYANLLHQTDALLTKKGILKKSGDRHKLDNIIFPIWIKKHPDFFNF